jgi:hypothetical protein
MSMSPCRGQARNGPSPTGCSALDKRNFRRSLLTDVGVLMLAVRVKSNLNLYLKWLVSEQTKEDKMVRHAALRKQ